MRKTLGILVLLAAAAAHAQTPVAETLKEVQAKVQAKQYAEAAQQAETALQQPDLAPDDRARLLKAAADAMSRQGRDHLPAAVALYERMVEDAALPAAARLDALKNIADLHLAMQAGRDLGAMDLSAAEAAIQRGLALPGLTPNDRAVALKNIGQFLQRQDHHADARAAYEQILELEVRDNVKNEAHRLIAGTWAAEGQVDRAIALWKAHGQNMIELYRLLRDPEKQRQACEEVLNNPEASESVRWGAFNHLPCWDWRWRDLSVVRELSEKYLPAFLESDPNRALVLQRKFNDIAVTSDPAFVEWAAPLLLAAPRLADKDYATVQRARVEALAVVGKRSEAIELARELQTDQRLTAPVRLWAQIIAASLAGQANEAQLKPLLDQSAETSPAERAEALLGAARAALRAGDEPAARRLYSAYEAMLSQRQQAVIECAFMADAPFDVGSWLASPLLKQPGAKLDRPYGGNLEFLLATDSAITGRNAGAEKGAEADSATDFYAACDAEGIHLFFHARDTRAREIVAGLIGGGSYEMYFAPGEHQAYHTFLIDLPRGGVNPQGFITMYPNPGFRLPSLEDGTLRTQTRATDSGFATHLFLSWELFYDKLPTEGTRWQVEAIRWTRSGGLSFGGSQSVHNRSSWGDIVFRNLSRPQLIAIKRGIVFKAANRYKRAKGILGALGQWSDAQLGDPAFYQAHVVPLIQRLDPLAEMVSKDLTDEQVEQLFREAVPAWMEAPHHVAALRAAYLQDKHLAQPKP